MGKILIITGVVIFLAGVFIQFAGRIPYFGKLPGDIRIERDNFTFYFPLTSSILVSVLVSIILLIINKSKQ